jgi:hypothetical protein
VDRNNFTFTPLPLHFLEAPVGSSGSIASKNTVLRKYEINRGKVAQFRSLRKKKSLIRKIHQQAEASVLKYILCSVVNMSDFIDMNSFNTLQ